VGFNIFIWGAQSNQTFGIKQKPSIWLSHVTFVVAVKAARWRQKN
jgi:hypothetical protein